MAQIIFRELMNPYLNQGNREANRESYGKYSEEKHFKHSYVVRYSSNDMNPVEFMEWICAYMTGIVMINGNRIWFNNDADETTLVLTFSGVTSYGDQILWKYHKHPNNGSFHQYLPYNNEWPF